MPLLKENHQNPLMQMLLEFYSRKHFVPCMTVQCVPILLNVRQIRNKSSNIMRRIELSISADGFKITCCSGKDRVVCWQKHRNLRAVNFCLLTLALTEIISIDSGSHLVLDCTTFILSVILHWIDNRVYFASVKLTALWAVV